MQSRHQVDRPHDTGDVAHESDAGEHGRQGGHADHAAMFRDRLWLSVVLTLPVLVFSEAVQELVGFTAPTFTGSTWITPAVGTVLFIYGGWPFLSGAVAEARSRTPGMMLLVAMAITVAYAASLANTLDSFSRAIWWELALLIDVMLLGHWVEMRAVGQARGAMQALAELLPDDAELVAADGSVTTVRVDQLSTGDVVLVRPGARVPADGTIVDGTADVDESMITGESTPVPRSVNDRVVAGTVVADSSIRVEVDALGEDTTLAGIQRMVAEARASRSRTQVLADRAAAMLFYVAVVVATITAVVWLLLGEPTDAVNRTVAVLVIACPHALGLAVPLVTAISTSKSARHGILVKDRSALERVRLVDAVLFDKTGTLTRGEHGVTDVTTTSGVDRVDMLRLAGSAEADSEHPLARAIHGRAVDEAGALPTAASFASMTGRGVRATVDGRDVQVGGPSLLRELQARVPSDVSDVTAVWEEQGVGVLHVVVDGEVAGAIGLADEIREVSAEAVRALHDRNIRVVMITGDAQQVADAVAVQLDIDEVFAEVLPEDKDAKVAELQDRGLIVAMVGDGVNDAPALARADIGVAIGAGTDVAIESAGLVLASDDPRGVVAIHDLSEATYRKMIQNLWWAAGYNVAALPLAAGVLAPIGFVLPIAVGAALMSASTVIVALNAQLLRRVDLEMR